MKIRPALLFICILISRNLFSQDTTVWKRNVIDSIVSVIAPEDLEISMPIERFTIGNLSYGQIIFVFLKIDVLDTVPLPKDTIEMRNGYDKLLKGYMKNIPAGVLIGQEDIKQGYYFPRMDQGSSQILGEWG